MKNKLTYSLIALASLGLWSCDDDNDIKGFDDNNVDRMFTPLFRTDNNTGKGDSDPYRCHIEGLNTAYLAWFGVDGAAAYQIQMSTQSLVGNPEGWDIPENILLDTIVGPEVLNMTLPHLEYFTPYRFGIRALDPRGTTYNESTKTYTVDNSCPYHSKWWGHGGGRQWADYLPGMDTQARYEVPDVIDIQALADNSFRVIFDLKYDGTEEYLQYFKVDDNGNYVAQAITIEPAPSNRSASLPEQGVVDGNSKRIELTAEDYQRGYVDITGLSTNSAYVVNVMNTDPSIPKVDAVYNTLSPRTTGPAGDPIFIPCDFSNDTIAGAHEYQCARIDTIISNFNNDINLAEGTIFELEGGKNYYIYTHTNVMKGFTLRTRPEDVAAGKRAKVFLGGIDYNGTSDRICNWNLGMNQTPGMSDAPILVGEVKFYDIDFEVPLAANFGDQEAKIRNASGNYFANMFSQGLAVTFASFEIHNCTFQGLIRGFIRVQGQRRKVFNTLIVDNCIFWNCMYYNNDGRGYAWFASDGKPSSGKSNVFANLQFTNNTIVDCPNSSMFTDNNVNLNWPSSIRFNINFSNNTVLNYNTRNSKTNAPFWNFRYIPSGSTFTCRNNLFIQAKDADDSRTMYFNGTDMRTINGEAQEITVDFKDNYGCNWDPANQGNDAVFSSNSFSARSNSFGKFTLNTPGIINGAEELVVKASGLLPTQLMRNPNPPHHANGSAEDLRLMHNRSSLDGLFYNATPEVTSSEVYQKNIGDPRWKRGSLW